MDLYTSCQRCDAAIVLVVEDGRVPDPVLCERCRLAELELDNPRTRIVCGLCGERIPRQPNGVLDMTDHEHSEVDA